MIVELVRIDIDCEVSMMSSHISKGRPPEGAVSYLDIFEGACKC